MQEQLAEQPQERQQFASALFNEDLKNLLLWHKYRPPTEQRRFLKTLNNLYDVARHCKATPLEETLDGGGDTEKNAAVQTSPPPVTSGVTRSASTPTLQNLRPIDLFLQKRQAARTRKSVKQGDLQMWLEQKSASSVAQSIASSWTEWTEMTQTTQSTISAAVPTTKNTYRKHKRGFAVNRRRWNAVGVHDSTNNMATDGFPELLRFKTTTAEHYGDVKKGAQCINEKMYESMFRDEKHPFISKYLKTASPRTRDEFCQMARCLEAYRLDRVATTSNQRDFNLREQEKLWKPSKAKPRDNDVSATSVPLGTIQEMIDFHRENTGQVVKQPVPPLPPNCDILSLDGPGAEASLQRNEPFLPPVDSATTYFSD